jgi:hypothetical protein
MKIEAVNLLSLNVNDVKKEYTLPITFETLKVMTMKSTLFWGMMP